jgi:hypothetical protein
MPWPMSAGVLGMAAHHARAAGGRTMVSQRTPAITLTCSARPTCGAQGAAASANSCGLTAQTTGGGRPAGVGRGLGAHAEGLAPGARAAPRRARRPCDRRRPGARPHQAADERAAMLPPPMKAMVVAASLVFMRGSVGGTRAVCVPACRGPARMQAGGPGHAKAAWQPVTHSAAPRLQCAPTLGPPTRPGPAPETPRPHQETR